jgi:DNA-binding HxlR family transcriptional regulator
MKSKNTVEICPVSYTQDLIGGKYKSHILWFLSDNKMRFNQIQKLFPNATAKMLSQQLRALEKDKLVIRKVFPVVPPKTEYSLTKLGQSLKPVLELMYN